MWWKVWRPFSVALVYASKVTFILWIPIGLILVFLLPEHNKHSSFHLTINAQLIYRRLVLLLVLIVQSCFVSRSSEVPWNFARLASTAKVSIFCFLGKYSRRVSGSLTRKLFPIFFGYFMLRWYWNDQVNPFHAQGNGPWVLLREIVSFLPVLSSALFDEPSAPSGTSDMRPFTWKQKLARYSLIHPIGPLLTSIQQVHVSMRRIQFEKAWETVEEMQVSDTAFEAEVVAVNRGGAIVLIEVRSPPGFCGHQILKSRS